MNDFTVNFFKFSITVPNGQALADECEEQETPRLSSELADRVQKAAQEAVAASAWSPRFVFLDESTLATDRVAVASVEESSVQAGDCVLCDCDEFYLGRTTVEHRETECATNQEVSDALENAVQREVYAAALAAWPDTPHPAS